MKKILFVMGALLMLQVTRAQSKTYNDPNAQVRDVKGFHAVEVSNAIELHLSQGNEEAVAVSAIDTKYRDKIITEVVNGVLKIKLENESWKLWNSGNKKLRAYVSFKEIDKLNASGASSVLVEGSITVNSLDLHLSGASDFKGSVKLSELKLDQSGASDITISGSVNNLIVETSGASDVKGYDLVAENCSAKASGASDIRITVNKELNVHASGASSIYYKGSGVIKEMHSSGASSVSKKS